MPTWQLQWNPSQTHWIVGSWLNAELEDVVKAPALRPEDEEVAANRPEDDRPVVGHFYVGWTSGRDAGAGGNGRAKNTIVTMICIYSYVKKYVPT